MLAEPLGSAEPRLKITGVQYVVMVVCRPVCVILGHPHQQQQQQVITAMSPSSAGILHSSLLSLLAV